MLRAIDYCPWCGSKFLTSLANTWWDILDNQYNITDPTDSENHKIPAEFRTDKWWKKRSL